MVWVAGVDGCKRGWFKVSREIEISELRFDVVNRAADLLDGAPSPEILAIDIPIGLPDEGRRECEQLARRRLGRPRASSVFPAPIRPAIRARSREEASEITAAIDGRRVGAQAWGIYPKIREVDELLQSSPDARVRIREIHPELCFWSWSGNRPIVPKKQSREGRAIRLRLAEDWLGPGVLARARGDYLKKDVADDDILDAIAALWTATRIARGEAETIPIDPPVDSTGLRMELNF